LGEKDLAYLLFLLDEMTHISSPISEKDYKAERNVNMAMRVEQIISLFLSSTEKAIIVAHSQHVNKGVSVRDNDANHYPMGYYLQQKYKKQYYALTIQAGIGSHRQDSLYTYGKNIVEPLQAPFPFAFEQAALNTGSEYFYYVADQLPEAVLGLHLIGRPGREKKSFQYCSISSHFDALVFIRQSSASVICEEYPRGHFYWYIRGIGERFNSLKKAF
jgi:erythromycin esterase-like protein